MHHVIAPWQVSGHNGVLCGSEQPSKNKHMRRTFSLLLLISFAVLTKAQDRQIPNDTLVWRMGRPLVFTDFTGEPIESSNLMGEAFCLILTSYDRPDDVSPVRISATAVFDRTNSWISRRAKQEEMLLFQVTFNIFETYARKLRKDASELRGNPYAESEFQRKYASSMTALTYQCNALKRETRMGSDKAKLLEWDDKVKKDLKELEAYR